MVKPPFLFRVIALQQLLHPRAGAEGHPGGGPGLYQHRRTRRAQDIPLLGQFVHQVEVFAPGPKRHAANCSIGRRIEAAATAQGVECIG